MSHLAPLVARRFQCSIFVFTLCSRQIKYDDNDDDDDDDESCFLDGVGRHVV